MALLFDRQLRVEVAGLTLTEPRMSINIERQIDELQARGELIIYNLNDAHETRIRERGGAITISAGYPSTISEIYRGQIQRVVRARENLAKVTRISLGDEMRANDRLGGISTRAYSGPVNVRQIVMDILTDLALPAGPLDNIPSGASYTDWYWASRADAALTVILRHVDCRWFLRDGVIRINKVDSLQSDAFRITVSPETGLVDVPIITDEGAEVRMLLNPAIVAGVSA